MDKYDPVVPGPLAAYACAQFVVALVAAYLLLQRSDSASTGPALVAAFFVTVAALCAVLLTCQTLPPLLPAAGLLFAAASLAVLLRHRRALTSNEIAPLM